MLLHNHNYFAIQLTSHIFAYAYIYTRDVINWLLHQLDKLAVSAAVFQIPFMVEKQKYGFQKMKM